MILYYSATGNTKFIATELAKKLDDQCTDLLGRIRKSDFSELHSDKPYIVCAPVYMSEMPRFISEYIKNTSFTGNRAVYFIADNAGYAGITSWQAKKLFKKKNMEFMGCAEPVMPNNYYISHYKPSTDEEIKERLFKAFDKIDEIANSIQNCEKLAAIYTVLDHLYPEEPKQEYTLERGYSGESEEEKAEIISDYGDTEFLSAISGRNAESVWLLMDELMTTLMVVNPRLYDSVMRKIQ
jgi:flavodoxin